LPVSFGAQKTENKRNEKNEKVRCRRVLQRCCGVSHVVLCFKTRLILFWFLLKSTSYRHTYTHTYTHTHTRTHTRTHTHTHTNAHARADLFAFILFAMVFEAMECIGDPSFCITLQLQLEHLDEICVMRERHTQRKTQTSTAADTENDSHKDTDTYTDTYTDTDQHR